ncbi:MAG TPA: hypothetical protein VFF95_00635 [Candidatus Binatus sp.]|nr:hypothetical protein [Candidatus Binatus sp.]
MKQRKRLVAGIFLAGVRAGNGLTRPALIVAAALQPVPLWRLRLRVAGASLDS